MAELEPAHVEAVNLTEWLAFDVEDRAVVLGRVAMKAQAYPHLMTNYDYFLVGLGNKDPDAIGLLDNDARQRNHDIDWGDMFSLEAVFASWDARSPTHGGYRNDPDTSSTGKGMAYKSWASGNAALEDSWVTRTVDIGGGIMTAGLIATSALMTAGLAAAGVSWVAGSVSAVAAMSGLAMATKHPKATEAIVRLVNAKGFSGTMNVIRRGTVATARTLQYLGIGSLTFHEVVDVAEAITNESVTEEMAQLQLIADLERAGYTFEVPGQALGEGEVLAYEPTGEDVIIYDPEGNMLSSEEREALLTGEAEIPEEFRLVGEEEDEGVPAATSTIGEPEIHGVADQYAALPSSTFGDGEAPQWLIDAIGQASMLPSEDLEKIREAAVKQAAAEEAANPYLGVDPGYFRLQGREVEERVPGSKAVPYSARTRSRDAADAYQRYGEDPEYRTVTRGGLEQGQERSSEYVSPYSARTRYRGAGKERLQHYGGPIYRLNDIENEVAQWDTARIVEFQQKAVDAGLINPDTSIDGRYFSPGTLDAHTLRALEGAMAQANLEGSKTTYDEAMNYMIENREKYKELFGDGDQPPTWTPSRAYFEPDYATISQNVKNLFADELGRKPNDWEMTFLADHVKGDTRTQYDIDMAAEKDVWEAAGRAEEYDEPQEDTIETYEDVDPYARLAERFDERYEVEIDQRGRQTRMEEDSRNLFGGLSQLSRMGGGV